MKYQVRTRLLVLKNEQVFQKTDAKKVFQYASDFLEKASVELVLEELREVFNFLPMKPRDEEPMPDWIWRFGLNKDHGWWEAEPKLLQILLIPPVEERGVRRPVSHSSPASSVDKMWCMASASPVINTLGFHGQEKITAGAIVAQSVARLLGAKYSKGLDLMCPQLGMWGYHGKGMKFQKESVKQIRSWFSGKKFDRK